MNKVFLIATIVIGTFTSCAQNKSAPDYLENKKFPDSIQQFKLQNTNGELVSFKEVLEKHKGKKVVLDFWASWCKDCLEGLPKLQELQAETSHIDYVFLSLDKTEERWKNAIKKLKIEGDHYFMSEGWKNTLTNYIGLDWIPRYMVLDENGIIIVPKEVKVNGEFKKLLVE